MGHGHRRRGGQGEPRAFVAEVKYEVVLLDHDLDAKGRRGRVIGLAETFDLTKVVDATGLGLLVLGRRLFVVVHLRRRVWGFIRDLYRRYPRPSRAR